VLNFRPEGVKIKKAKGVTKFKVRCSKYLYTFKMTDQQKAEKVKQSLPPGTFFPMSQILNKIAFLSNLYPFESFVCVLHVLTFALSLGLTVTEI